MLFGVLGGAVIPALAAKTYSDNLDGTVTDPTTGLQWMRCSMGQTWDGSACTGTASTYTFDQAVALTGMVTFAGQSDWRVPNVRELGTIVGPGDYARIDMVAFPNTPISDLWSDSPLTNTSGYAWGIEIVDGIIGWYGLTRSNNVRLVRSGQSFGLLDIARPDSDYVDLGDGTVKHTPTRLIWQRCAVGQIWTGSTCNGTTSIFSLDAAKLLTSSFAGKTDWRLPTEEELLSLVDYSKFSPATNVIQFPKAENLQFLSGSPDAYMSLGERIVDALFVQFDRGLAGRGYRSFVGSNGAVRFVRAGQCFGPLVLSAIRTGTGQITVNVETGVSTSTQCSTDANGYYPNEVVTLTASPAENLITWGGACASAGSAPTCTVTMDSAKSVTATFKDTPLITGLPINLTFPLQNKSSTSTTQSMTLTNTGTAALEISSIATTGDFSVANSCGGGLGVSGFCTLNVSFSPTAIGPRKGSLTITSNAPGSPHTVNLTGSGMGAVASLTGSILATPPSGFGSFFANTNVGEISNLTFALSNSGGDVLNISGMTISGDYAKSTTCSNTLAPSTSCSITIAFSPTLAGARTGSLVINSDSASGTITLGLNGTGVAVAAISLNPSSLTFAPQAIGTSSAAQVVKLTNSGGAALNLSSISVSGDFSMTNNCGSGLGAAGFCNLSVIFSPTLTGNRSGAITITSNSSSSPHTLALSGSTPAPASISLDLLKGWNLLGNGQDQTLPIATLFGDPLNVTTVWKWDVTKPGWQFYAPSMDTAALQTYTASKGYGVLTAINPGEGFWVNAVQPLTVAQPSGTAIAGSDFSAGKPYALKLGWNLVSTGDSITPSAFNIGLSATPPSPGTVPLNLTTLWAWDNPQSKWYFYAPNLEGQGGTALIDYITGKGYLDFTASSKILGSGVGFWVNKP
jgi:hypothetical protein